MNKGRIIIIAGPSGVGKGTVIGRLLGLGGSYALSVSATTRAPRPGERDGVNYYFMTRDEFTRKISAGEMLEYAEYVGNLYGTPRDMVREKTAQGYDVILEIEVDGARQVLKKTPDAIAIFLLPPSAEELAQRLCGRGTEAEHVRRARLDKALRTKDRAWNPLPSAQHAGEFHYRVVNADAQRAAEEIHSIVTNAKSAPQCAAKK